MNPQMFGRYLLLDKVAAGGMAEVWRAKYSGEGNFQKIIAIKKILPHVSEDEDFITMFTDEANITSSMNHANIGQVTEFSKVGDTYYISMEYVSGRDLKSVWSWSKARGQIMPVELSAYIVSKMCDGLDYAHGHGVVHRDISPQNVLLSWEGDVKVIDFGIAKATEKSGKTRPGTLKGKFAYMAPEQIRGLPLDGRSDIFAIGVVLYELVTGQRGFQAESEFSLLEMVRNVEIRPPSLLNQTLPAELERIIYKALSKDRDTRYLTGSDMSVDLQQFMLQRGRPPQPRDLAAFLRENFTVDYEKEKARLDSYREVNPNDYLAGARPTGPASPPLSLDEDSAFSSSEPSAFAEPALPPGSPGSFGSMPRSMPGSMPGAMPGSMPHSLSGANVSGPHATARPEQTGSTATNVPAPLPETSMQTSRPQSPWPKRIAAGLFATLAIAGIGVGLFMTVLQPVTTVVVTVQGPAEATVRFDALPPQTASPTLTFEKIPKGPHTIFVEAPGFKPMTMPVVTEGQAMMPLSITLQRMPGKLVVTSDPSGAAVVLDGKPTGKVTPATFELDGDTIHEVRGQLPDYKESISPETRVPGAQETTVKLVLKPAVVKIRIVSTPEGASVKMGELDMGMTPLVVERAPDDPYPQISVSSKGCETMQTTVPFDREKAEDRFSITLKCR